MKRVVLLGSTGSIGTSTLKVAEDLPDRIRLLGLAAGNNAGLLLEQTRKHQPAAVSISDPEKVGALREKLGSAVQVYSGTEGLLKLATLPEADVVLIAIVGTAGLQPALAALCAFCAVNSTPRMAAMDPTLMIDPPPRATRCGQAARVT